jgi:pimeloyl-ACP methyl ester carboxylesterase
MAWFERGDPQKPAVVLCHGMGLDHREFDHLTPALADDWRVIQWDMPGHGLSGPMPDPCALESFADALERLLEARGIERPVLVGFSFGGMVAQEVIRRRRMPIRAFVAYACYAPFSAPAPAPAEMVEAYVASQIEAPDWASVRAAFAAACAETADGRAALLPAIERTGRAGLASMTRALFAAFRPDPSFTVDVPMMVLRGARDANAETLAASERALLDGAMDGRRVIIDGAGHCAHLDAPAEVCGAVRHFLDGLSRPAHGADDDPA